MKYNHTDCIQQKPIGRNQCKKAHPINRVNFRYMAFTSMHLVFGHPVLYLCVLSNLNFVFGRLSNSNKNTIRYVFYCLLKKCAVVYRRKDIWKWSIKFWRNGILREVNWIYFVKFWKGHLTKIWGYTILVFRYLDSKIIYDLVLISLF